MASALESTVQSNNYLAFVIITAIEYDHLLAFSNEVEYIWNKPWTWVSTLYIIVRYVGSSCIIANTILRTSLSPQVFIALMMVYDVSSIGSRNVLAMFRTWAGFVFFIGADLVIILRVWVLYGRSRFILAVLLILFAIEMIPYAISCVWTVAVNIPAAFTIHVSGHSLCGAKNYSPLYPYTVIALQVTFGTVMCLLVAIQFISESWRMYRATNRVQLSTYMIVLAREGVIYFLAVLLYAVTTIIIENAPGGVFQLVVEAVQVIPPFTLTPRFILSLRALYARDLRGRCGSHIDTAFGLTTESTHQAFPNMVTFASDGQEGESEEIAMEAFGDARV